MSSTTVLPSFFALERITALQDERMASDAAKPSQLLRTTESFMPTFPISLSLFSISSAVLISNLRYLSVDKQSFNLLFMVGIN